MAVAYLGYLGVKKKSDGQGAEDRKAAAERRAKDVVAAAAARVQALDTDGPARNQRLHDSRVGLEKAAAALPKRRHAELRAVALELAGCTDRAKAGELRDELARIAR